MNLRVAIAIALGAFLALAGGVGVGNAGPDRSPHADSWALQIDCAGLGNVEVVAVGIPGLFEPAHIIGSNAVLIPVSFEIIVTFTPEGGAPQLSVESYQRNSPPNADLFTCTFGRSGAVEGGTLEVQGTVVAYLANAF